jgi:hypothetical protein
MSTPLLANVAVPLFFPQPLLALVVLIPIIAIEKLMLCQQTEVRWRDVSVANIFSTILGIPLGIGSVMLLGFGFNVVLDKDYSRLSDVILVLLAAIIPCFALSVYVEGSYLRPRAVGLSGRSFWFAIMRVHCFSYLALLLCYCLWISTKISR